ncbi:MAG TPA: hypothetical protein VHQ92_12485 [Pseudolabrys sp.]|jgi:hypothetical protein|nr:hypothetical protein [Pseudolabrys sp.]
MTSPAARNPVIDVNSAEKAVASLESVMDRLELTVTEETACVRAGRLREAAELDAAKVEFARLYMSESDYVKAARNAIARLAPEALERLRRRHDAFHGLLRTNLTVLATAHAVSEGIIRGVSGELARKQAPSTYGASGRAQMPSSKASPPLAISRTL